MASSETPKKTASLFQSLGAIKNWQKEKHGIIVVTSYGKLRLQAYDQGTIRVSISRNDQFEDFSYSVVKKPSSVNFKIVEQKKVIRLVTRQMVCEVQKDPARIRFLDKKDQVINEDDPAFGTAWMNNEVTTYKVLQEGERFLGLGEKTGNLDRRGSGYTNWNTEKFGYGTNDDPIYLSIPFYLGIHNGLVYGIFLNNSYRTQMNFGASNRRYSSFGAEEGEMDYFFFHGATVAEVIKLYGDITGKMPMPPLWSLGFQQCRYSYYPDKEVLNLARTFREKEIPADTIVLDIHYMEGYKVFKWDRKRFSNPTKMIRDLKKMGFNIVLIIDPGIKIEKGYKAYEEGLKKDVFAKFPDHSLYEGEVWPGWCHFPDFTKPVTRDWWGKSFEGYVKEGVKGFWNDMNEPASWGNFYPNNVIFDLDGHGATSKRARNLYGMQMARSTFEGTKALMDQRPFVLTRSGFAGVQRYSAVWTGDNVASEEHMLLGVRLVNSLGLSGVAFSGYDIGGFFGDSSASLFARWISIGTFAPFFRVHSMINSRDSEPWSYGEEVEKIARNYIKLRYALMPYIYSLFREAYLTNMPVTRSLAIDFTHDPHIYHPSYQNQFLFGPFIMVAPIESSEAYCPVYLPKGGWYNLHSGKFYDGGQKIVMESPLAKLPILVKSGAIIPMQTVVQTTAEAPEGTLYLHIYHGTTASTFTYYEDDGESYHFQNGAYYSREIRYAGRTVTFGTVEGQYKTQFSKICLMLHGFKTKKEITADGKKVKLKSNGYRFTTPIEKVDPLASGGGDDIETVLYGNFKWSNHKMIIKL